MTPAARISAAIEVLDQVLDDQAAEASLTRWARGARYAGSKDRAAVRDHVFQALRCLQSYACLGGAQTGRGLMIGALRAAGQDPSELFTGEGHAPAPLSAREISGGRLPETDAEHFDMPGWMVPLFQSDLGSKAHAAARCLAVRAPVTLRVNIRLSSVTQAIETLQKDGVSVMTSELCDTALRVTEGARRVAQSVAYRDGSVELQDASSQAAMAALALADGAKVLDFCAGGGGKTLALAARCDGRWFAHDIDAGRMRDLPNRASRAGVRIGLLPPGQAGSEAPFDMVLCDAPCSGSGTWRRAPEAKWRLTPERLAELIKLQSKILHEAARLVGPGGQLAYATCSVFRQENEDRIVEFLETHDEWTLQSQTRWPISPDGDGFFLVQLIRAT